MAKEEVWKLGINNSWSGKIIYKLYTKIFKRARPVVALSDDSPPKIRPLVDSNGNLKQQPSEIIPEAGIVGNASPAAANGVAGTRYKLASVVFINGSGGALNCSVKIDGQFATGLTTINNGVNDELLDFPIPFDGGATITVDNGDAASTYNVITEKYDYE